MNIKQTAVGENIVQQSTQQSVFNQANQVVGRSVNVAGNVHGSYIVTGNSYVSRELVWQRGEKKLHYTLDSAPYTAKLWPDWDTDNSLEVNFELKKDDVVIFVGKASQFSSAMAIVEAYISMEV